VLRGMSVGARHRELGVPAPITTRARGADVEVEFQADERSDTFDAQVTDADTELDEIRIMEEITAPGWAPGSSTSPTRVMRTPDQSSCVCARPPSAPSWTSMRSA